MLHLQEVLSWEKKEGPEASFQGCVSQGPAWATIPGPCAAASCCGSGQGVCGARICRGGPHPLSQGASLCPLLQPVARRRGVSSHFHTAPVSPSQEELAGTELMGPVCVEVLPNSPQNPGPAWGHRKRHVYTGHGKVSQRPQLGSHVASQSWSGHGHEVQLPEDSGGCEQLPPWRGASPPVVPESSRYVGTPVELESHQLPHVSPPELWKGGFGALSSGRGQTEDLCGEAGGCDRNELPSRGEASVFHVNGPAGTRAGNSVCSQ